MNEQAAHKLNHIREKGYRVTPQRQLILEAVQEGGGHLTAVDIYERVQAIIPSLNQATVYRTLDFLNEMRLIVKTEIAGRTVYELVTEDRHHHLVCRQCGYIQKLADHYLDDLGQFLLEEHGFKAEMDHMAISGLCAYCQET